MKVMQFRQLLTGQSRTEVGVLSFHQVQHVLLERIRIAAVAGWATFLGHQPRDTLVAVAIIQALDLANTEVQ